MSLISRKSKSVPKALPAENLSAIEKKIKGNKWIPAQKELFLKFFNSLSPTQKEAYEQKRLIQWTKSKDFQQMLSTQKQDALTQFQITSMMMIMMATIDLHFLFSMVLDTYLISFNIDAIVASVCLAFLVTNASSQFKLLRRFDIVKDFAMLDGLAIALCILVELLVYTLGLDLSIIILIATYFLEKRKLKYFLDTKYMQVS